MNSNVQERDAAGQGDVAFQANLYTDPNPTRRGLHLGRREWVEAAAARRAGPGKSAVEVGVGCGIFVQFLADCGASVTAIDINQSFLDNVAGLPGVSVLNCDATNPLPIDPADLVLCTEVLEHVPAARSQAMLHSFFAALKPGGTLILTTPQKYSTVELMAGLFKFPLLLRIAQKLYGHAEELGHINLMTRSELTRQIAKAGFVVEQTESFGFYLPVVAEFLGTAGWRTLHWLNARLKGIPGLNGLLWTQAYILRRPAA